MYDPLIPYIMGCTISIVYVRWLVIIPNPYLSLTLSGLKSFESLGLSPGDFE